jgi:hypothetical protein
VGQTRRTWPPTWCEPISLKKLVYLDGQQAVLYRSKLNPFLGRNSEALDPLEWLARMSDHPRQAARDVLVLGRLARDLGQDVARRDLGPFLHHRVRARGQQVLLLGAAPLVPDLDTRKLSSAQSQIFVAVRDRLAPSRRPFSAGA